MEFFDSHNVVPGDLRGPIISRKGKKISSATNDTRSASSGLTGSSSSLIQRNAVASSSSSRLSQPGSQRDSQRASSSTMPTGRMTAAQVVKNRLESDGPKKVSKTVGPSGSIPKNSISQHEKRGDLRSKSGAESTKQKRMNSIEPPPWEKRDYSPPPPPDPYERTPKPRKLEKRKKSTIPGKLRISTSATFDSPDPMLLTPSSNGSSPTSSVASLNFGRSGVQKVLVPPSSSAGRLAKSQASSLPQVKKRSSSDFSEATSDSDATPRANVRRKKASDGTTRSGMKGGITGSQGSAQGTKPDKAKRKKRVVREDTEEPPAEDDAAAFFKGLTRLGDDEKKKIREKEDRSDSESDFSVNYLFSSPVVAPANVDAINDIDDDDDPLDIGAPTAEQLAYCRQFVDDEEVCEYCGGNLPALPSRHLQDLKSSLVAVAAELAVNGKLPWQRTIGYCTQHKVETTTIPLGQRAGYPANVEFLSLEDRLEEEWLRAEIEDIMVDPDRTSLFDTIVEDIRRMGKGRWGSIGNQAEKSVLLRAMPGYYGPLGRTIILQHYLNLFHWGLLPELEADPIDGIYPTAPLTPLEFITHVVVPEAAILLIMGDKGWKGELEDTTAEWGRARKEAYDTWSNSGEYGRARFVEDDAYAKETLDVIQARTQAVKKACKKRRKGKVIRRPISLPRSVSPVKRSGSKIPTEVVDMEFESSQSTSGLTRSRQPSVMSDVVTPRGRRHSPIPIDLSTVSSAVDWHFNDGAPSDITCRDDTHLDPVQAFVKPSSVDAGKPRTSSARIKSFDRTRSNDTSSSYGMEDDWMGTEEAQAAVMEAERDQYGKTVVF